MDWRSLPVPHSAHMSLPAYVTVIDSWSYTDFEAVVKLSEDFNGADLRNVCTEAGEYTVITHTA